jgi:uncharacterized protein GlcG (DUF336 family)
LRVIRAAERRAQQIGVAMLIVVGDSCGVEQASHRMDGNSQASPTLAPLKAQTANAFRTGTHELAAGVANDPARLASIAAPAFTLLGGGVPLRSGGAVIGGVGVGGGSAAQDVDVAQARAAALGCQRRGRPAAGSCWPAARPAHRSGARRRISCWPRPGAVTSTTSSGCSPPEPTSTGASAPGGRR